MSEWTDIGSAAELEASSRLEADVDGYRVRVARVNGTLYAFEDRCTHDDSPLTMLPSKTAKSSARAMARAFPCAPGEALSPACL